MIFLANIVRNKAINNITNSKTINLLRVLPKKNSVFGRKNNNISQTLVNNHIRIDKCVNIFATSVR